VLVPRDLLGRELLLVSGNYRSRQPKDKAKVAVRRSLSKRRQSNANIVVTGFASSRILQVREP
jgi:hypothetical protein